MRPDATQQPTQTTGEPPKPDDKGAEEGRAQEQVERRPWWKLDPKDPPLFFWWLCW